MNLNQRFIAALVAAGGLAASSSAATYTFGNLVLSQVGPGSGAGGGLNSAAAAVTLREFSLSSQSFLANDLALPSVGSDKLTISGSATSEGVLTLSSDGNYLTIGGYDAIVGQGGNVAGSSIATSPNFTGATGTIVNRMVGRVDVTQSVSLYRMTNAYSGSNFRSVASGDGSTFYTAGTASTNPNQAASAGVRLFNPGSGTDSLQQAPSPTNIRVVNLALGGRVFASTQSAPFNGISEWSGGTATLLPGMAAAFVTNDLSPTDFYFASSSVLYVADEGGLTGLVGGKNRVGGLQRWDFDGANWNLSYRITDGLTAGLRGLTAVTDASGNTTLWAITADGISATQGNKLVAVTDLGPTSSFITLATAGGNQAFRGLDLIPTPGTGAMALLGLAMMGRRRR